MRRQVLIGVAGLTLTAFVIAGCRYRSAGEDKEPTPPDGNLVLVDNTTPDFFATETSVALTLQAQTPTSTETPSPSPTVWQSTGQETTLITAIPTLTFSAPQQFPTQLPSSTPTVTVQIAAQFPTNTSTLLPSATSTATATATATSTSTPTATTTVVPPTATNTPSITPSNTLPPVPTNSPSPQASLTFTPFPMLTPTVIAQGGGEPLQATLLPQQMTATAIIFGATVTAAFQQGTNIAITSQPGDGQAGITPQVTVGPTQQFPDCDHLIQPGDKLGVIARTYNVQLAQLATYNNITNWDYIKAGDTIKIPGCGRIPTPTPTPTGIPPSPNNPAYDNSTGPIQYVVQGGDNIYKLSVAFCVTMGEIVNSNPRVTNINLIIAGDTLTIPLRSQPCGTGALSPTATPTLQGGIPAGR